MDIETDGSIEPEAALKQAAEILIDQLKIVSQVPVPETKSKEEKKTKVKKSKS
jgi:DNA-directed RNA polymerase alpha subunit